MGRQTCEKFYLDGNLTRVLIRKAGKRQAEVAKSLRISGATFSRYLDKKLPIPPAILGGFSQVFGVPAHILLQEASSDAP